MATNIIFFTQLYYPDMTTTAIIMTDLVEDLAAYGLDAEVVCAQPTYIKNLDPQITQITQIKIGRSADLGRFPKSECHNGVFIRRVWSFLFDKNNILGRILNGVSCFFSMLPTVFSTGKNDLLNRVPGNEDKIHVIHNWADAGRVYPVAKKDNRLLDELGLRQKKVVMYSGNLGRYQPIEVMIGAAGEPNVIQNNMTYRLSYIK